MDFKNIRQKKVFLSVITTLLLSTSSFASSSGERADESFVDLLVQESQNRPIQSAVSMYSDTTPMLLVQGEDGRSLGVLKNRYNYPRHNERYNTAQLEAVENFKRASAVTKDAGVGSSFATTYPLEGRSLTFQEGSETVAVPFYGLAQPVVTLYSEKNASKETPLTSILNKLPQPHGALSLLALYDAYKTVEFEPVEAGNLWMGEKEVSVEPLITRDEYAFCMASLTRETVEDDFLSFMLTQSGDTVLRNWMIELDEEAILASVKSIDFGRLFSRDLMCSCPLALWTLQGFYPLSDTNREKVLSWEASHLTRELPEETAKRVQDVIQSLQTQLQEDPMVSLQNLYFKVLVNFQKDWGIGRNAHYGWSYSGAVGGLTTFYESGIPLQDPAYVGLSPQYPNFQWLSKAFEVTSRTKVAIDTLEEKITGRNYRRYR